MSIEPVRVDVVKARTYYNIIQRINTLLMNMPVDQTQVTIYAENDTDESMAKAIQVLETQYYDFDVSVLTVEGGVNITIAIPATPKTHQSIMDLFLKAAKGS